jgi:hypothetical protein
LLQWLEPCATEIGQGKQVALLREVFGQQFVVEPSGELEPVKVHATGVVQNPHDPQAEWSAKGVGKHKKEWVGYKAQVAETLPKEEGQIGFIRSVVTQYASESDDPGLVSRDIDQASRSRNGAAHRNVHRWSLDLGPLD